MPKKNTIGGRNEVGERWRRYWMKASEKRGPGFNKSATGLEKNWKMYQRRLLRIIETNLFPETNRLCCK
jgi:hypothetical protein